jgi:hypothetical protein
VKGYYFYVDFNSKGTVTKAHAYIEKTDSMEGIEIELQEQDQFLHVAAVDVAGNLGETSHIGIKRSGEAGPQYPTDDSYVKNVQLFTEQIRLTDTEFVHQKEENVWYIKADKTTMHRLQINAFMDKAATWDFQIDAISINTSSDFKKEWLEIEIPHGNVLLSAEKFPNDVLNMNTSSEIFFQPGISQVERRNHAVKVELLHDFSVGEDSSIFRVYPKAIATFENERYISSEILDVQNGMTIIPDGEAPRISGLETLQNWNVLDMTDSSKKIVLWATDDLSGLEEFSIQILNNDNHMREEFYCDENGKIEIEINKENPLFIGKIEISAIAVDKVNNAYIIGEDGLTFTLETNLYGERNTGKNELKTGDGVILDIFTQGYV